MYTPPPSAEEAAAFGLTLEEASGDPVDVWPDNLRAVNVFTAMSTQWRAGMGGATGLDYAALPVVLRLMAVPRKAWPAILEDIRVLEAAALDTMQKQRKG